MKGLFRNYLFLPLLILLGGLYHVSPHVAGKDLLKSPLETHFSSEHAEKHNFFDNDYHHHRNEAADYELVEQNQVLKKDWVDKVPLEVFALKKYSYSLFSLLSRRLSLDKPVIAFPFGDTIYLAICVLRL